MHILRFCFFVCLFVRFVVVVVFWFFVYCFVCLFVFTMLGRYLALPGLMEFALIPGVSKKVRCIRITTLKNGAIK